MAISPRLKIASNGLVTISNGLLITAGGILSNGDSSFVGGNVAFDSVLTFAGQSTTPSAPGDNKVRVYSKNNILYYIAGAGGTETRIIGVEILGQENSWTALQNFTNIYSSASLKVGNSVTTPRFSVDGSTGNIVTTGSLSSGEITSSGQITATGITVGSGTVTGSTFSGNASTATKLQTARTISGVSFDGSANIVLTLSLIHI